MPPSAARLQSGGRYRRRDVALVLSLADIVEGNQRQLEFIAQNRIFKLQIDDLSLIENQLIFHKAAHGIVSANRDAVEGKQFIAGNLGGVSHNELRAVVPNLMGVLGLRQPYAVIRWNGR